MNADDRTRMLHMPEAEQEATAFARDKTLDDLIINRLLLLGLVKEIEIIGEAASRISAEGQAFAPGIAWNKVTAMRNRLTHAYFEWNLEVIWSTLTINLPPLVRELQRALSADD
jgi:uncharacterized protein with HEPN domain